jgi:hypothetical protein
MCVGIYVWSEVPDMARVKLCVKNRDEDEPLQIGQGAYEWLAAISGLSLAHRKLLDFWGRNSEAEDAQETN